MATSGSFSAPLRLGGEILLAMQPSPPPQRKYLVVSPVSCYKGELRSSSAARCSGRSGETAIVKFCVLASGSSGNCALIATEKTRVLVDAGLSFKELTKRLASIGEQPGWIDAV